MGWTRTGSVSVANGNPIVYGNGTVWASGVTRAGDTFKAPDGRDYEVLSVQSNTQLTLASPYLGTTASAQAYAIINTGLLPAELAVDLSNLQSKYLATVAQLYEWETSAAATVPLTNPATGVTANVTPLAKFLSDTQTALGGKANAANPTTSGTLTHTGNATFSGGRPLNINPSTGVAALRGDTGGWITEFGFQGSAGTAKGGFGALGSGDALTYLYIGDLATPHLRFNDAGVIVSKSVPLGYGPNAWGATTQPTNKRTNVALHKPSGQITMHPEALAAGASATFQVACSHVSPADHIGVLSNALVFAADPAYAVEASTLLTGAFYITVKNISAVSQANALVLNFCVFKGAG